MAVAWQASGTTADTNSAQTLSNSSLTVGSGSNQILIAFIGFVGGIPTGLTVVWDPAGANQPMTQVPGAIKADGTTDLTLGIYALIAPTSGNKTCKATWTGAGVEAHLNVASFTGANQTSVAVAC